MTSSLEGWPTKAKEPPSLHEVRLASLDTNPVFKCLGQSRVEDSVVLNSNEYFFRLIPIIREVCFVNLVSLILNCQIYNCTFE